MALETETQDGSVIAMADSPRHEEAPSEPPAETPEDPNPTLTKFMQACQIGNLDLVKELISSKQVQAGDTFDENITGLHWAAINNRLNVVQYLMENEYSQGDPNAIGGSLRATPLQWACRNGLVYIVDYFLTHTAADPTIKDSQQYNALHLAVHSSNITLVVYVVLSCVATAGNKAGKQIHIDDVDGIKCTPLHWASYQGDILTVNFLLKYGADVNLLDQNGMSPLHWAFIRGYKSVLSLLLDAGADIFHKNSRGADSFDVSKDMNAENVWLQVLREADRSPKLNWQPRTHWILANSAKTTTFLLPYVLLPIIFSVCSFAAGLAIPKLFLSGIITFAFVGITRKFLTPIYSPKDPSLFKTPFLAGIFSSTAFWCIVTWLFAILPVVWKERFFVALMTAGSIVVFTYTFFKALFINPGFVPVPSDDSVILELVRDLISKGLFDTEHFCVNTFVRKPLRSKYSRFSNRLIARFDHYCPWVYNDIGVRNHKLFMAFTYAVSAAIVLYTIQAVKYFDETADKSGYATDTEGTCFLLSEDFCKGLHHNHFIFNLTIFCCFQMIWLGFLCVVQTFQIFRGVTTWEFTSLNKKMNTPALTHSTVPAEIRGAPRPSLPVRHHHPNGLANCAKLLGLDQFAMTAKVAILSLFKKTHYVETSALDVVEIPTDFGWKQNFLDFWFIGEIDLRNLFFLPIEGENNLNGKVVDYYKLYEYPARFSGSEAV